MQEFLRLGATVVACSRTQADLTELEAAHAGVTTLVADVSQYGDLERLVAEVSARFGKLDVLVNNVGTNLRKFSQDYEQSEYERLCRTNQDSAFHLSRLCFPLLKESRGCVVNISSISGETSDNTGCVYAMNKVDTPCSINAHRVVHAWCCASSANASTHHQTLT